jgi:hypothetical protein
MPRRKALPVKQDDETMTEHRIARSKLRVRESRALIKHSSGVWLIGLKIAEVKSRQRAETAQAKLEDERRSA